MTSTRGILLPAVLLILSMLACSVGTPTPIANPLEAAGTIVSLTLQALGSATPAAPSATSAALPPTATATTKPSLTINTNAAKCVEKPSTGANTVTSFTAGTVVDMIAKDTADGFWLVKDPASGSSCWVQVKDATPAGSFDLLPEVTPVAQTAQKAPAKPGSSSSFNYWEYDCAAGTVSLHWLDNADNEDGYHVYRLGQLIADLPANSTTFSDTIVAYGTSLAYSITAYNGVGESAPLATPNFSC